MGVTEERIQAIVEDFAEVSRLAGCHLHPSDILTEFMPAPHQRPTTLPRGKMAVYVFGIGEWCLKVGKAGPKTVARYTYQHYSAGSAPSTLAASILRHIERGGILPWAEGDLPVAEGLKGCIERNTWRANILIDADRPASILNLLEAFVQARLLPIFEGSQKGGQT